MISLLIQGKDTFLNAEVLGMENLQELLARLPARHRAALQWFIENAGKEKPWPDPLPPDKTYLATNGTHLATKAKGIYKPEWSEYALSVRQVLHGPYPDREPKFRSDGTWSYRFFKKTGPLQTETLHIPIVDS